MKQKIKNMSNRLFGVDELKNKISNLINSRYNASTLYPQMDSGAITIFDDFVTQVFEGVTRAVHEIQNSFDVNAFHMFQGQAMDLKR